MKRTEVKQTEVKQIEVEDTEVKQAEVKHTAGRKREEEEERKEEAKKGRPTIWWGKKHKGGRGAKAPRPLCVFLGSQNSSNCCLSLVFVGFNLLILCWLAGANDELHSFKFNPYFLTFETFS